ncbi:MAG: metallophosphoesterase family protein [Spirochaetaceae bacterium]
MKKKEPYYNLLQRLCSKTGSIDITDDDKIVIFSDLHIGKRNSRDDFMPNSDLFMKALTDYYLPEGYTLILNGDIEELHRYSLNEISEKWQDLYLIFDKFAEKGRFFKIFGNHDSKLFTLPREPVRYTLHEAVKLDYKGKTLFLFHGHQLSYYYQRFNDLMGLFLRYVAKPLRIKHYSVAHDNRKKFTIEQRLYEFASDNRMISIIGHTHRPLFESLSKVDELNYQIETHLRNLKGTEKDERGPIEKKVRGLKKEIDRHVERRGSEISLSKIYSTTTVIPCVFNSGCVLGKRGFTGVEIENGNISLVHWFDRNNVKHYVREEDKNTTRLDGTGYYRSIIKKDDLDYIFTRIELLT